MRCENNFVPDYRHIQHLPLNTEHRFALLLLYRLFHTDRVGHQLQLAQNLGFAAFDVAFDSRIGQQLGQIPLGHHQVEQLRAIRAFGIFIGGLYLAHLLLQLDELLHGADEAEKNEPDLDIPAEIERRQARLAAIEAAKARLEERQRQADAQRGRSEGDERKPKGGKSYQRDFGVPPPKAQDIFTDSESRIMKRAGGGFDYSYNAQTAVDETAHIIVAAEVVNTSSDVHQLLPVLDAVEANTGAHPKQALADAGYRSEEEMTKLAKKHPMTELVIALRREGREQAKPIDADRYPHTLAMQAKFQTDKGKADYRKRKWIAEPPNGWNKNVLGFRQFSMRGLEKAKAEFKLVCMALNLRRMGAMQMV